MKIVRDSAVRQEPAQPQAVSPEENRFSIRPRQIALFFLWMLAFTLLARGTSGALLPEVQLSTPAPNTITQSLTATGTIQWAAGSLFYLPEGLLVEAVFVSEGEAVQEGDKIAALRREDVEQKFAEEYNKYMADRKDKPTCYLLEKIDPADNWMDGNEGDPYRYNHDGWESLRPDIQAAAISKSEFALGYNGTLDKVAWTKENTTTKSVEMSHGFFFNSSIKWGKEDVAMHGVTTSLEYSDGKGNSTSKGTAVGASCTVTSLDKQSLVAEGIPAPVVDAYRFHWTLGQWQRHLSGAANNKTPFIGYSVTNLSSPPRAIDDLDKTITRGEGNFDLKLSWTKPDCENGHPQITGYYVYSKDESGAYTKISEKLSADATEYEIKNLDLNGKYTYAHRQDSRLQRTGNRHRKSKSHPTLYL